MRAQEKQPKVVSLLKKAFAGEKLTHAYLFSGEAGVGKQEIAFWMSKRFLCIHPQENEPCGVCTECKRVDSMNHPDLHFIEPEGLSIKIDQIRSLQKEFHYKGVEGDKKCYIIKHVDKMTVQAANSLLKFLEEPNGHSLAILLTENKQRLLDTIISRVQTYQFQPLSKKTLYDSLLSDGLDSETAYFLAQLHTSGKELLEEDWFYIAKDLLFDTLEKFIQEPYEATVFMQSEWPSVFSDKSKQQISIELLICWFREVLWANLNRPIGSERKELILHFSQKYNREQLTDILSKLIDVKRKLRSNTHYGMLLDQVSAYLIMKKETRTL